MPILDSMIPTTLAITQRQITSISRNIKRASMNTQNSMRAQERITISNQKKNLFISTLKTSEHHNYELNNAQGLSEGVIGSIRTVVGK